MRLYHRLVLVAAMLCKGARDNDTLPCQCLRNYLRRFSLHLQACVLQAVDNLSVALVGKVSDDIIRYLLAHILHRYQLLSVGNLQLLQRCEAACQFLRRGLAHHAYAEGEEHTLPWHEQAVSDTVENVLRRLLAEAFLRC